MRSYRDVLANPAVRTVLLLGTFVRIPFFVQGVVLALHVVQTLDGSYAQAGLVVAVVTICQALSAPWRGALLDRHGLRPAIAPSLLVVGGCWMVAPFVGYVPLLLLAAVAGLFEIPIFGLIRQAVMAVTTDDTRRSALALESVSVELSFIAGPIIGIAATHLWSTATVLCGAQMLHVLGGAALWLSNPPLRGDDGDQPPVPRQSWFRADFVALCVGATASITVLAGTEITFVAAARQLDAQSWLGLILAVGGVGSLIGGLIYGGMHRPISTYTLLGAMSAVTIPMALATSPMWLAVGSFVAGSLCAPTLTSSSHQLSRIVPEAGRGEAIGWHGGAMTAGNAVGSTLCGIAIDSGGFPTGFIVVGIAGMAAAALCVNLSRSVRLV